MAASLLHFRECDTFGRDFLLLLSGFVHTGGVIPLLEATVSGFLPRGEPGPAGD